MAEGCGIHEVTGALPDDPRSNLGDALDFYRLRLRGIWGALVSAAAFVIPSFLLLLILPVLYFKLGDLWCIKSLFKRLGVADPKQFHGGAFGRKSQAEIF